MLKLPSWITTHLKTLGFFLNRVVFTLNHNSRELLIEDFFFFFLLLTGNSPLSLWSAAHPASRSARGMASTGRCHLSGGRPRRRCSPRAWPGWCLCTVLWRWPAPDLPAGPRSSWCRPKERKTTKCWQSQGARWLVEVNYPQRERGLC